MAYDWAKVFNDAISFQNSYVFPRSGAKHHTSGGHEFWFRKTQEDTSPKGQAIHGSRQEQVTGLDFCLPNAVSWRRRPAKSVKGTSRGTDLNAGYPLKGWSIFLQCCCFCDLCGDPPCPPRPQQVSIRHRKQQTYERYVTTRC